MKRMVQVFALTLLFAMLVGCLILNASAANVIARGECGNDIVWSLDSDGTLTITGNGAMYDYGMGESPFSAKTIKRVVFAEGITYIGCFTFYNCHELEAVTLPESLLEIEYYAFRDCVSLSSIHLPKNITVVKNVFYNCPNLATITVDADNAYFSVIDGVLYSNYGTDNLYMVKCPETYTGVLKLPETLVAINTHALNNCRGITEVVIPAAYLDATTRTPYCGEFSGCSNLEAFTVTGYSSHTYSSYFVENGSIYKKYRVFYYDGSSEIRINLLMCPAGISGEYTISAGCDEFDFYAFAGCKKLTSLFIPSGFQEIDGSAFGGCQSLNLYFEGDAPKIRTSIAYYDDNITFYYIPGTSGWTGNEAFDVEAGTWNGYKLEVWEERTPIEMRYAFAASMTASLELESEVYMVVSPVLTAADGTTFTTAEAQTLEDNVGIMIWDATTAPAEDNATMKNAASATVITGANYNPSTGRFDVKTAGIAAKNLGDNLTIRSFYTDGEGNYIYGKYVASYSPKKYCYNQIKKNSNVELTAVCVALLNYGAAAQTYFGHNTDALMNAELTDVQQAWEWDESLVRDSWSVDTAKEGALTRDKTVVSSRSGSLELEGAINVVFSGGVKNITVAKAELLLWTEADFNAADVLTEENATETVEMTQRSDGKYEYICKGIAAKEMFCVIYGCQKYTDTDGNVYYGGVMPFCAERYGYNHSEDGSDLGALAQSMVIYGDAARTYFG